MSRLTTILRTLSRSGPLVAGRGGSPNGASSFHLTWDMPPTSNSSAGLLEVSAELEVLEAPRVRSLYFWALQVDFADERGVWGGAHTGLQWNARYPHGAAVNWGGYASQARGGGVLPGTVSPLAGFADDPNTLAYHWVTGRPYRLRVFPSPEHPGAWRAEVTDVSTGGTDLIRDLLLPADRSPSGQHLTRPVVWSEVFADCDAPSVVVRWSHLRGVDAGGALVQPRAVRVNYQTLESGGCPNTTSTGDGAGGLLQVTNVPRVVKQGAFLNLPPGPLPD